MPRALRRHTRHHRHKWGRPGQVTSAIPNFDFQEWNLADSPTTFARVSNGGLVVRLRSRQPDS